MNAFLSSDKKISEKERIEMTLSCHDCDYIPKVENAGSIIIEEDGSAWQVMFNGIEVVHGGYFGDWMAEIIQHSHGHHEPQEEVVFYETLKRVGRHATMIELGCFWGFYSLWFAKQVSGAQLFLCEPDPAHLEVARKNLIRNGIQATLFNVAAGKTEVKNIFIDSLSYEKEMQCKSVTDVMQENNIDFVDVLHLDVQGAETAVIEELCSNSPKKYHRFIFVSTHHYCISGDPLTHQYCLHLLKNAGAHIICEHTVEESYSGDGLIVASFQKEDFEFIVEVSLNRASNSLFGSLNFDLAERMAQ